MSEIKTLTTTQVKAWRRDGYARYRRGPHVIERTCNPTAARVWYVVAGPHAGGGGLGGAGLAGGFWSLRAAKAAVDRSVAR